MNYYNENDPFAVAWLRNLIAAGHVSEGIVDDRSIRDVTARDLDGFRQCHFFAGIGVWSYALRLAGWPDDRPVWTGSCPCQPFSAAGQRKGFDDTRHLWPEWFRLVRECRPESILGEQVDKALGWLDLVSGDLESESYAVGAAIMGAHSVGAPHIRQRIYWVAHSDTERLREAGSPHSGCGTGGSGTLGDSELRRPQQCNTSIGSVSISDATGNVGQSLIPRLEGHSGDGDGGDESRRESADANGSITTTGDTSLVDLPSLLRPKDGPSLLGSHDGEITGYGREPSFWSACDWLPCTDGKARCVEPGTFPLAHGAPARVGRLRGYGNALVAPLAAEFIRACIEVTCVL